jgi:hypothetical protein
MTRRIIIIHPLRPHPCNNYDHRLIRRDVLFLVLALHVLFTTCFLRIGDVCAVGVSALLLLAFLGDSDRALRLAGDDAACFLTRLLVLSTNFTLPLALLSCTIFRVTPTILLSVSAGLACLLRGLFEGHPVRLRFRFLNRPRLEDALVPASDTVSNVEHSEVESSLRLFRATKRRSSGCISGGSSCLTGASWYSGFTWWVHSHFL